MPVRKWDSGLVVRTIRQYHRQGKDVSYNAMARVYQGLVSAANYYHGNYRAAVKLAGIDYDSIRRKPCWDARRVIKVVRKAHREGKDLNWSRVSVRRDELGWAAKAAIRERLYGNWSDALKAAGLDPSQIGLYRHWSAQDIKRELRRRAKAKQPVNSKVMQNELPGLYGAAVRQFGSYDAAIKQAGLNPADVSQRRDWDRALVRQRLREFEKNFGIVSQVMLRRLDSGLLRAARICYGDLPKAIRASGVQRFSVHGHRAKSYDKPLATAPGWRTRRGKAPARKKR